MLRNVTEHMEVDHVATAAELGPLLVHVMNATER
jgi:hypothetical protein